MAARDLSCYVSEFVGTFFLVLTVGLNVLQNTAFAPISIGSILMAMVFSTGSVSGGHFNPAVTFGVFISNKLNGSKETDISPKKVAIYIAVQLLAGLLAAMVYWTLLGATFTLKPGVGYSWLDASIVEVLFTLALVLVVLNVACTGEKNDYFGLAIGFTVISAAFACGGISGCSLNPAVSVGVMFTDALHIQHSHSLKFLPLYVICPLLGAGAAAGLFHLMRYKLVVPLPK